MTSIPFDADASILVFPCRVEYKTIAIVNLCLDTGASTVVIRESILKHIGFDLASITHFTTFGDASQTHLVPIVILNALSLGPERLESVEALAYTIPEEHGIDGVIGLNFLRRFKRVSLDFEQNTLTLEQKDVGT